MAEKLQQFIEGKKGCALLAWLHHFDKNGDGKIDYEEFESALTEMEFQGDIKNLFAEIDCDNSGILTLNEVDSWSADLWASFRRWCANSFASADDMVLKLSRGSGGRRNSVVGTLSSLNRAENSGGLTHSQFTENAVRFGWYGGFELVLFRALDSKNSGRIDAEDIAWFDAERTRQHRRNAQKIRVTKAGPQAQTRNKANAIRALHSFAALLRHKYGSLFGAWRRVLDRDGSMQVQRKELFKACQEVGWYGDVSALWHALDSDDSGQTTLDELTAKESRQLAVFKRWAEQRCGGMKEALRALSLAGRRKAKGGLDKDAWVAGCQKLGVPGNAETLFDMLDWEGLNRITYKELKCIDKWVPCEWLTADPSEEAAQRFVKALLSKYGHALKAWRIGIDRDSSGKSNWKEFKLACERIGFKGNAAGAWLVLDANHTGYITIDEIDRAAGESLAQFRRWAQNEFGGVMVAFKALDTDESGSLSFKEFRKSVKDYNFRGDVSVLFNSLNMDKDDMIGKNEVAFLDEWEMDLAGREILPSADFGLPTSSAAADSEHSPGLGKGAGKGTKGFRPTGAGRGLMGKWRGLPRNWVPSPGCDSENACLPSPRGSPSPEELKSSSCPRHTADSGANDSSRSPGLVESPGGTRFLQLSDWDGPLSARHFAPPRKSDASQFEAWQRPASVTSAPLSSCRSSMPPSDARGPWRPVVRPASCVGGVAYMPCASSMGFREPGRPQSRGARLLEFN